MIVLIVLLLQLLAAAPAVPQAPEGLSPPADAAGVTLQLPEVVLFARDTRFLPVPRPPLPPREAGAALPARLTAVPTVEVPQLPAGGAAEAEAGRVPGGAATAAGGGAAVTAASRRAPPPRPAGGSAAAILGPPAAVSANPSGAERVASWSIALWPGDSLAAQGTLRQESASLAFSAALEGALADGWVGFEPALPSWALLRGALRTGPGTLEARAGGGFAARDGEATRLLAEAGLQLGGSAGAFSLHGETRGLGLWRGDGPGGGAPSGLLLGAASADLELGAEAVLAAAALQPRLRFQLAGWRGEGDGPGPPLAALVSLQGRLAFERAPLAFSAGGALLVEPDGAVRVFPQAALETSLSRNLALEAGAEAFLHPLPVEAAALLETLPDPTGAGAEHGWSARAALTWVYGPPQSARHRLSLDARYLQGRLLDLDAARIGLARSRRLGIGLSASGTVGTEGRYGLSWRGARELSGEGLLHALSAELRVPFPKTPLEAILHGEWTDAGALPVDPADLRAVPGGSAGLALGWRLRNRTLLAARMEVRVPPAGVDAADLRFGLSWGTRESE